MSRPRSSKLSAFQVFSTVTKVSSSGSKKQTLDGELNQSKKSSPKMTPDMNRKSSNAPKSLISVVNQPDDVKEKSLLSGKKSKSVLRHSKESKTKSDVKSLMDISFDFPPQHIDKNQSQFNQDKKQRNQKRSSLKKTGNTMHHLHSTSNDSQHRTVSRESQTSSGSIQEALVVELQSEDSFGPSPRPLLDFESLVSPKDKPVSLLDLPPPRQKTLIMENLQRSTKIKSTSKLKESKKRKMENEPEKFTESEKSSDTEKGTLLKKRERFEPDHKPKKIKICRGKKCHYLIIPSSCSWLHLYGKAQLSVEKGTVSIMAYTLQLQVMYDVISPATGCLLAMHVDETNKILAYDVKAEMSRLCGQEAFENLKDLDDDTIGIVRVKKLDSRVCDYLTTFTPFTHLFKIIPPKGHQKSDSIGVSLIDLGLKVAPQSEMAHTCMNWSPKYNDALDKWSAKVCSQSVAGEGPILLTCGGKNSGKSILNRCSVNVALQSVKEVAYLDCDVGQTEFSPPGTLSLHIIKTPVHGPPFWHQRHAERMVFFGDVSVAYDPGFYIRCLHYVFQAYIAMASESYLPLIVNTMGFPDGVGLMLFIDTMNIVKPDLVIQLESCLVYANFPTVTREMVALDEGWTFNKCPVFNLLYALIMHFPLVPYYHCLCPLAPQRNQFQRSS